MKIKIQEELNIGCHPYQVVFNKLLYDAQAFGRSSMGNEYLQLNPTNTLAQNEVTLWHEIISILYDNLIGERLSENVACALSEGICAVFKEMGIEFDFSKIKELTEK
jgi:hypothetical protein